MTMNQYPQILLGDFNSQCDSSESLLMQSKSKSKSKLTLLKSAGIDCVFVNGITGTDDKIQAYPSDHPSIVATLINETKAF